MARSLLHSMENKPLHSLTCSYMVELVSLVSLSMSFSYISFQTDQ